MRFAQIAQKGGILFSILSLVAVLAYSSTTAAPFVTNVSPEAKVSFTFDDGLSSALTHAAPVLAKHGFAGTSYVISGCVGTVGTCPADEDASYMSWGQIKQLQDQYHWEIGAHTDTHPSMTEVPKSQQEHELKASRDSFALQDVTVSSFATPYGDYNLKTLALAAKYYESHRGFWDMGSNKWPYNERLLYVQQVQSGVSVETVKRYIDTAVKQKSWLVLAFHDIRDEPSAASGDFQYATTQLDQIAAYVKARGLPAPTINQGIVKSDINLLPNPSFERGLTEGWHTDTPSHVKLDTGTNGSYPEPANSIVLTSGPKSTHLFSPTLPIDPAMTYMVKSFLNVTDAVSGHVGYYIDEYDGRGRWVSGQWKVSESSAFVENINFLYKPSSRAVADARLQLYVSPGSGIKAYVDSFQWFPVR